MFRKPKGQKGKAAVRKRPLKEEDDDEEEEEEASAIQQAIRQTQKKQKLLSSLPIATGTVKKHTSNDKTSEQQESSAGGGELSVLAQKHQQAMEDYIQNQLGGGAPHPSQTEEETSKTSTTPKSDKAALYQEIVSQLYTSEQPQQEEDRGAVLVGGTGMAEVLLPKTAATSNSKEDNTNRRLPRIQNKNLTSSAVPLEESTSTSDKNIRQTHPQPVLLQEPATFRSMVGAASGYSKTTEANTSETKEEETDKQEDDDRMGFAAFRGKPKHSTSEPRKPYGKYKDDQAFSKFIKNQRERQHR